MMRRSLGVPLIVLMLLSQSCSSMPDGNTNYAASSAVAELREAQAKVEELKQSNSYLKEELNRVRGKIDSIEYEIKNQRYESEEYKEKNENLKNQLTSKRLELERLENSLKASDEQERIYQEKLESAFTKLNSASSFLSIKEKEYTELRDRSMKIAEEAKKTIDQHGDEKLLNASVVFNTPKSMFVGESLEISLKVSVERAIDDAIQDFIDDYDGIDLEGNAIHAKKAKLGKVVVASLRASSGIAVQTMSGAGDDADGRILDINNPDNNKWNWEIFAKNEGDQWIRVSLYYEKKNQDGVNESRSFGTWRSKTIKVTVKSADSVSAFFDKYVMPNIEFLWGAILLPLGALIGARWKKRSE